MSLLLLKGALMTLHIALTSIAIGFSGGLVLGILNTKKEHLIYTGFVWVIRGTPLFVQVLLIYYALPELLGFSLSPFAAGVIALGLNSTAYVAEIIRGGIKAIPEGQWDAAYVIGLTPLQTLKKVILPQMLRITLPSLTNELSTLVKETSILMIIGVTELTKVSRDIVSRELDPVTIYTAAALLYLGMTSALSLATKKWMAS